MSVTNIRRVTELRADFDTSSKQGWRICLKGAFSGPRIPVRRSWQPRLCPLRDQPGLPAQRRTNRRFGSSRFSAIAPSSQTPLASLSPQTTGAAVSVIKNTPERFLY